MILIGIHLNGLNQAIFLNGGMGSTWVIQGGLWTDTGTFWDDTETWID